MGARPQPTAQSGDATEVAVESPSTAANEPTLLPLGFLIAAVTWLSVISRIVDRQWFAWFPARDVTVWTEAICVTDTQTYGRLSFDNTGDVAAAISWVFIVAALLAACGWADQVATALLGISITLTTVTMAWHGITWFDQAVTGQHRYFDVIECEPSPALVDIAVDRANYFRGLSALCVAYLGLVLIAGLRATRRSDPPRVPMRLRRWIAAGLVAAVGVLPLWGSVAADYGMSGEQEETVKWFVGYPLSFLLGCSLASLIPYGPWRSAGITAVRSGLALAFSLYASLALFEHGHVVLSEDGRRWENDLSDAAVAGVGAAQQYFLAVFVSLCWLWGAALLVRLILRRPSGSSRSHEAPPVGAHPPPSAEATQAARVPNG